MTPRLSQKGSEHAPHSEGEPPVRVLLAEDDREMRKLLAWSLDRAGFDVVECQDGLTLVKKLDLRDGESGYDIVISDIRMPGLSGLQALRTATELGGCPPMILISAFADEDARNEANDLGAAAMLAKPFDVEELIEAVRDIVPFDRKGGVHGRAHPEVALPFPLDISFRHESSSEPVRAFIQKLAQKLTRFGERIQQCRVVVDQLNPKDHRKRRYHVALHVSVPGQAIVVEHEETPGRNEGNLYLSLQIAFGVAYRKLRERQSQQSPRAGVRGKNSRPQS